MSKRASVHIRSQGPSPYFFNPPHSVWQNSVSERLGLTVKNDVQYEGVGLPLTDYFYHNNIRGDGNCFFRGMSFCVSGSQDDHFKFRQHVVNYEKTIAAQITQHLNINETFSSHVRKLSKSGTWARDADVLAAASLLGTDIYVYQRPSGGEWKCHQYSANALKYTNPSGKSIYLNNTNSNHFDVVQRMFRIDQTVYQQTTTPTKQLTPTKNKRLCKEVHRDRKRMTRSMQDTSEQNIRRSDDRNRKTKSRFDESNETNKVRLSTDTKHASKSHLEESDEIIKKRCVK